MFLPLQLEVELVQKEEKLLETDMIYEHIARLTDKICATAENGKQGTLLLATRVRRALCSLAPRKQNSIWAAGEMSCLQITELAGGISDRQVVR